MSEFQMSEIEKKVKNIIVDKLAIEDSNLNLDSHFISDLGADSLDIVELIMEFEREFNISIPDNEAESLETVRDVLNYLLKNIKDYDNLKK
jgi:acyl carrier protein